MNVFQIASVALIVLLSQNCSSKKKHHSHSQLSDGIQTKTGDGQKKSGKPKPLTNTDPVAAQSNNPPAANNKCLELYEDALHEVHRGNLIFVEAVKMGDKASTDAAKATIANSGGNVEGFKLADVPVTTECSIFAKTFFDSVVHMTALIQQNALSGQNQLNQVKNAVAAKEAVVLNQNPSSDDDSIQGGDPEPNVGSKSIGASSTVNPQITDSITTATNLTLGDLNSQEATTLVNQGTMVVIYLQASLNRQLHLHTKDIIRLAFAHHKEPAVLLTPFEDKMDALLKPYNRFPVAPIFGKLFKLADTINADIETENDLLVNLTMDNVNQAITLALHNMINASQNSQVIMISALTALANKIIPGQDPVVFTNVPSVLKNYDPIPIKAKALKFGDSKVLAAVDRANRLFYLRLADMDKVHRMITDSTLSLLFYVEPAANNSVSSANLALTADTVNPQITDAFTKNPVGDAHQNLLQSLNLAMQNAVQQMNSAWQLRQANLTSKFTTNTETESQE